MATLTKPLQPPFCSFCGKINISARTLKCIFAARTTFTNNALDFKIATLILPPASHHEPCNRRMALRLPFNSRLVIRYFFNLAHVLNSSILVIIR